MVVRLIGTQFDFAKFNRWYRLDELHAQQSRAKEVLDWARLNEIQAQIDAAEAERTEIMRRTEPEDTPKL